MERSNAEDVETRRSITGYILPAGGPITRSPQRQKIVTLKATEAEHIAMTEAVKEAT